MQNPNGHQVGDKLRIRTGPHSGERGILVSVDPTSSYFKVALENGTTLVVQPESTTNYSLAARRAWQAKPKQAGRPKSTTPKKVVTVRIAVDVWERLEQAVELGLIQSRESAVNTWLRERVSAILAGKNL